MLLIALAAATAAGQPSAPPAAPVVRQAQASVRIVSGARISAEQPPEDALVRETQVGSADGSRTAVRLIEFP